MKTILQTGIKRPAAFLLLLFCSQFIFANNSAGGTVVLNASAPFYVLGAFVAAFIVMFLIRFMDSRKQKNHNPKI